MTKGRVAILFVAAMVFLTVGFVIGQMVQAAGVIPGSADDPLVAKSYVEEAVTKQVANLQAKIDQLQSKVTALEEQLASLGGGDTTSALGGDSSGDSGGSESSDDSQVQPADSGQTAVVTGDLANVRSGAGTTYDIMTTLHKGDTVSYLGEENSWYRVVLSDGREGWVANWLVQVK